MNVISAAWVYSHGSRTEQRGLQRKHESNARGLERKKKRRRDEECVCMCKRERDRWRKQSHLIVGAYYIYIHGFPALDHLLTYAVKSREICASSWNGNYYGCCCTFTPRSIPTPSSRFSMFTLYRFCFFLLPSSSVSGVQNYKLAFTNEYFCGCQ